MDRLLIPTKEEMKFQLKREYRERQSELRKERIFNPRKRIFGIDKEALDQLVQEKKLQNVCKQKEEKCFTLNQNRLKEIIDVQLDEARAERRHLQCEINDFRNRCQQKNQAREFDLNDPLYIRKMSTYDGLHWLGIDPDHEHRKKLQQEQQKSWLNQQIQEKMENNEEVGKAQKAIEIYQVNQVIQLKNDEQNKRIQCRQNQSDTAKFNQSLAQTQKQQRMLDSRNEDEDNLAEIMNNMCSDILTENKETAVCLSLFGGSRINPAMYRGMTDEQLNAIRKAQLRQIEEKRLNIVKQREAELLFHEMTNDQLKLLEIEDQKIRIQRNQCSALQHSTNMHLLTHQKQRNNHLNKEVYKFTPTEDYFAQFNTTSR